MYFSINAYKFLLGLADSYRLCKDGTWKQQAEFIKFDIKQDMLFASFESANHWLQTTGTVVIDGKQADTMREENSNLFNLPFYFEIVVHRTSPPKQFTKKQLKDVLLAGDDRYNNSLVIDYNGNPLLLPLLDRPPNSLSENPIRFETFQAGNGYVGNSITDHFVEATYTSLVNAWAIHLDSGRSFHTDHTGGYVCEEEL